MNHLSYSIILDLDDVIYPFCQGITEIMRKEGFDGEITQWDMHHCFGLERKEFWDLVTLPKHLETLYMQPIPLGVQAQLRRLRYSGHRVHIVTARENEASVFFAHEIVKRDNLSIDSLNFASDKAPMVDELDASFSLDDRPKNYIALDNQFNHLAYLMDRSHNQGFMEPPPRRVYSVKQFTDTVLLFQDAGVKVRGEKAA